jgi:hypothetical protein
MHAPAVFVPSVFALGDAAPKGSGSGTKTTGRAVLVEARVGGADESRFFSVIRKQPSRADLWGRPERKGGVASRGKARARPSGGGLVGRGWALGWSLEVARAGRDGSDGMGAAAGSRCREQPLGKGHSSPVQFSRVVLAGSAAACASSEPERTVATSVTDWSPTRGWEGAQHSAAAWPSRRSGSGPPASPLTP